MDRRRKAAPLPIFNKRPRQALVAHPNNVYDSSELSAAAGQNTYHGDYTAKGNYTAKGSNALNYGQDRPSSSWQGQHTSYYNQPQTAAAGKPPSNSRPAPFEQENAPPPYQTPPRGPVYQSSVLHTTCVAQGSGVVRTGYGVSNTFTTEPKSTLPTLPLIPTEKSKQPQSTSADTGTQSITKLALQELRILTATAQGVQHWSKFQHISCLLFEVFGSLNSAVTMEGPNAKQFMLKTSDGIVRCIFWEMDRLLPPLVRGHALRAVGNWDTHKAFLKCYSVRPTRSNEEQLMAPAVVASDRVMRQVTASVAET